MAKSAHSLSSFREKVTHTHESITSSHHEAGHTIYALLHFSIVSSVYIYKDKDTKRIDGMTHYDSVDCKLKGGLNDIQDQALLAKCLDIEMGMFYAGLVAEKYQYKLHSGSDKFPSFLDGSSQDLSAASSLIKKWQIVQAGSKRYNYKKRIIRKVTRKLEQHWEDVTIIAHALFQRKRLNFDNIKKLLIKKSEKKEFWKEQLKIIEDLYCNGSTDEQRLKDILSL
jgi:hypothetical protein